ncbi:coiled-coil domain-containing protein 69 isoform X2 [Astatotilapia calliptera]|uniref:coiled-coil domain-containing protein 69 isoform X2 n=1 Tax=Astatotilapia calliptera TaxID=8154 RepID=UPI000E3FA7BC|nr:coiled-coil domain-containing protein 69 isoform X2 [Astatotilapia calliptera]
MGCTQSKKKSKGKKGEKTQKANIRQDDEGKRASGEPDVCLEKQLERFEWQLRILREANRNPERVELLKDHGDEELCGLVLSILDKVKTETTADLNILHEQKSKSATEEHERHVEELQRRNEHEKNQLTEKFQAAENVLKAKVEELKAELQVYNELKRRVEESMFKKDLQRNIQAHGSPGAFWESEQESLVFVIEMKSERVQEQNRKLQQMDTLAAIEGAARPEGGAGEAGSIQPEAFSGKRAADVQAETQGLVPAHPPAHRDAGGHAKMTDCESDPGSFSD